MTKTKRKKTDIEYMDWWHFGSLFSISFCIRDWMWREEICLNKI